jgi:hypothetical protein
VSADRPDDRYAEGFELGAEVLDLTDAGADVVVLDRLGDSDLHRLQVAPREPAVRMKPLEHGHQV